MKILNMLEPRRNLIAPSMIAACRSLENAEYAEGNWTGDPDEDYLTIRRREEIEGPNVFDVPEDCIKNNDADILYTNWVPIGYKTMDAMPCLRVIGCIRTGLDNIDVKGATERGILVINAGGHNANAVSDFAIGLMLCETRGIARLHHRMMLGEFPSGRNQKNVHDMENRTVGLVGFGYVGKLVTRKLSGFNMNIIIYDPFITQDQLDRLDIPNKDRVRLVSDLDELLKESDFVSLHARLTPENGHMIGERELRLMKPGAFLINTARAGLVDTEALIKVLSEHAIGGAGIDVYDDEPLAQDSPLRSLDNVTLTPHHAGVSEESTTLSAQIVIDHLRNLILGRPDGGLVNPEVLENPEFKAWLNKAAEKLKE